MPERSAIDDETDPQPADPPPHAAPADEVLDRLGVDRDGLTGDAARARLEEHGANRLPEQPKEHVVKRFLRHFHDVLIYVLIGAALVTALLGHWLDTVVILAVVVINALIGFIQEGKAAEALAGIREMLSAHAQALRDGSWGTVDAEELVPGDVIRVGPGDRVPADVRLLETSDLLIEEAALTGESEPAWKSPEEVDAAAGVGDRACIAHSGTIVRGGTGTGVVVATGADTQIGRISSMLAEVEPIGTPLTRQMTRFGQFLSGVVVAIALVLLAVGRFVHGNALADLFLAAIGFAVAAIPEGLPAVLTITLARGVQIMARRNAITRRLNAVETLGSVTVICSDKTGTLTKNEMTVRHLVTVEGTYEVTGTGYAPDGEIRRDGVAVDLAQHEDLASMVQVAALTNDAQVSCHDGRWELTGEPTEGALRTLALKAGNGGEGTRRDEVPFSSENRFMATLDELDGHGPLLHLKGAPDRLLERCDRQGTSPQDTAPLDAAWWNEQVDELSAQGLRVLAAAVKDPGDATQVSAEDVQEGGFVFLGLFGIIDPPRPEAIEAVAMCQDAGIRVKMITGDHAGTAMAIAREMGIGNGEGAVTGAQIEETPDAGLAELARACDVFARTSPEHKIRLVTAMQSDGEVVAMTGDGANDAPALKRADVGVAMGVKGTEATKEAAEIVLADDNFSSIERAVEEGRTIYDNLRKAIVFTLPTNGGQALVILVAVLAGWTLPLTPLQTLWVNMVTAVTLALALAFEPAEPGVMNRPPRDSSKAIIGGELVWRIIFVSVLIGGSTIAVFFLTLGGAGATTELARTVAVNTLVMAQLFYLFNCRFLEGTSLRASLLFSNRAAWGSVAALIVLQLVLVYAPFMQAAFKTASMAPGDWVVPVLVGLGIFVVVEIEKTITRRVTSRA